MADVSPKYKLIDSTTGETVCELSDYTLEPMTVNDMLIKPADPLLPKLNALDVQKVEDLIFLCRENYLMLRKLMVHYGYTEE